MQETEKGNNSLKNWNEDDRPREKMFIKGPASLSDSELLALLINTGTRNRPAPVLARDLLQSCENNLHELGKLSIPAMMRINGIGKAKAVVLAAALELGRRRNLIRPSEKLVVRISADIASHLMELLKDHTHEVFAVLFLNQANKVKHFEIVSHGGITGTIADPRIIFKKALETGATSLILSHNHPSGNLRPSQADELLTQKMKSAAGHLDIKLLDHIIVSEEGYYSFADEGKI